MSEHASKENISTELTSSATMHRRQRMDQNFLLIWLDPDIDESKPYGQHILTRLRSIVHDVRIFKQQNETITFIRKLKNMQTFLVISPTLAQDKEHFIDDIPQTTRVFILDDISSTYQEECTKTERNIQALYTDITAISEALQSTINKCNYDSIAVSFVSTDKETFNQNLDQLEPSFMYTQVFKDIILQMKDDEISIKNFIVSLRNYYVNNVAMQNVITEFECDYCPESSILWYTRESFVYRTLNNALRMLDSSIIINMRFIIRDLHQQIKQLYQKQINSYRERSFIVYRGQAMSTIDFDKLLKTKDGLIAFNNFLSTSQNRDISFLFAEDISINTDMIGILFQITIDLSITSIPFASIREVSYYPTEEEILFSMHSIFRINEITQMDNNNRLYQVNLKLTAADDRELRILTERMREEVAGIEAWRPSDRFSSKLVRIGKEELRSEQSENATYLNISGHNDELLCTIIKRAQKKIVDQIGWERLGLLLTKIDQFDKAEKLYDALLEQTSDQSKIAAYYNILGYIRYHQGDYTKAIEYHEKALEIRQKTLSPDHIELATSYENMALVYHQMGEYLKSLEFHKTAHEIFEKTLPSNHLHLASSYNNIGVVYYDLGDDPKALSYLNKAIEIFEKTIPNHPNLAQSYSNIAAVYDNMGEYVKTRSFYQKALKIRQKTLPQNHRSLAISYSNIGLLHGNMEEYTKALSFHKKALEIQQKTLPPNHPSLATTYNNIGLMYSKMDEYSQALTFHEKELEILRISLHSNHPNLADCYADIGVVYYGMDECSKAFTFYEKALEIRQKTLHSNHPKLAPSYYRLGLLYVKMGEYSQALSFLEKALEIYQKHFSPNHLYIATCFDSIAGTYYMMEEYSKSLSYLEQALQNIQASLPPNHSHIRNIQLGIQLVKKRL